MFPELFELPFVHVTIKSYGFMMVVGFLVAVSVMRRMASRVGENPEHITNTALYALITGVLGARVFYVIQFFDSFRDDLWSVFAVWKGGLVLLGGVILAVIVTAAYLKSQKAFLRKNIDILATGLMIGLAFGRIGCLLNGCCFGAVYDGPCSIRFPYGSYSYASQATPDPDRDRSEPLIDLPAEYFGYRIQGSDKWQTAKEGTKFQANLKPFDVLTDQQKQEINEGKYQALPVHPAQIYSSLSALFLAAVLYMFWRRFGGKIPGATFGLMFIIYGIARFMLEMIRDDNPFEDAWWIIYKGGTISQNIGIYMMILGSVLIAMFVKFRPAIASAAGTKKSKHKMKQTAGAITAESGVIDMPSQMDNAPVESALEPEPVASEPVVETIKEPQEKAVIEITEQGDQLPAELAAENIKTVKKTTVKKKVVKKTAAKKTVKKKVAKKTPSPSKPESEASDGDSDQ